MSVLCIVFGDWREEVKIIAWMLPSCWNGLPGKTPTLVLGTQIYMDHYLSLFTRGFMCVCLPHSGLNSGAFARLSTVRPIPAYPEGVVIAYLCVAPLSYSKCSINRDVLVAEIVMLSKWPKCSAVFPALLQLNGAM